MASVYKRGNRLWCSLKDEDGKWISKRTKYVVGQEAQAKRYAQSRQAQIDKRRKAGTTEMPTVKTYGEKWVAKREGRVASWRDERARLRLHVYPTLGSMKLDEVRPRHVRDWVLGLRDERDEDDEPAFAPRTIRQTFQTLGRVFKSAVIEELVVSTPVLVEKGILPPNMDKDPAWRAHAVYARAELQALISSDLIPADRRLFYALQGLGGMRSGEVARLRWCDYEPDLKPLGRMSALKTKTKVPRQVPVHPTLAGMLAEWKLSGWVTAFDRRPEAGDLIVPVKLERKGRRGKAGTLQERTDNQVHRVADLEALGLRHRRGHDLRRTFISLAREDGARADILEVVTHGMRANDMMSLYTTFPWKVLCGEVSKLEVVRVAASEVATLAAEFPTVFLQSVPAG